MAWIDPDKEAKANERLERSGHKSSQQNIRDRGGDPRAVMDEIAAWRELADEKGLIFTTDPKHELVPQVAEQTIEESEAEGGANQKGEFNED
jgi:capsid protein